VRLSKNMFPDPPIQPDGPRYLEKSAAATPTAALADATRESLRVVDLVEAMLQKSLVAQQTNDKEMCVAISRIDDQIDSLHEAIKLFLARLQRQISNPDDRARSSEIMSFALNLEHIGDIIDRSLLKTIRKKARHKLSFSHEGSDEIA